MLSFHSKYRQTSLTRLVDRDLAARRLVSRAQWRLLLAAAGAGVQRAGGVRPVLAGTVHSTEQYSAVQYSTAQYWQTDKREYCKLFDHMALIVDLGGQNYLVDVGFGNISQPSEPIRWNINFFLTPVTCALVDKVQKLQITLYH